MGDTLFLDATLRPNPPMSAAALKLIISGVASLSLAFGGWFVMHGAWPITPFMGADIAFLAWAFHASRRAARLREELRVSRSLLSVDRIPPRGKPQHIEFNPYWVRVELEDSGRGSRLTLSSHGRREQIGAFLPPGEKLSVAQALSAAIGKARTAPFQS
jgi:uncharacterized membrane protein